MAIKSAKKEFYKSEFENCKSNQHEKWNFINIMLHRDSKANTPPQYIESQGTKLLRFKKFLKLLILILLVWGKLWQVISQPQQLAIAHI